MHLMERRTVTEEMAPVQTIPQPTYVEENIVAQQVSITYATSTSISKETGTKYTIPIIIAHLHAMQQALPRPSLSSEQKQALSRIQSVSVRDLWLTAVILTACIASIASYLYYAQIHDTLLYNDAYSHLRIARSVFDSTDPGITQLGSVWLPLPHVLMFPFIWNSYLWRTGLAGSLPSMAYYVITAPYLYLIMRRLTGNRMFSYLGTLVFLLNANILYLQSTPLTELACICTITMTCYYFLAWVQEGRARPLIICGGCTFLAVLARYEGWSIFLGLCVLILVISRQKRYRWEQVLGNLILYVSLAGLGVVLWLIWNQIIFGDALAFQRGPFSAQAQQQAIIQSGKLYTYHNLWLSLVTYTLDVAETVGPVLFGLAIVGLFLFLVRRHFSPEALAILTFLSIFGFDILSLYTGQIIIQMPGVLPGHPSEPFFNVRYGSEMVGPVALLLTILADSVYQFLRHRQYYRMLIRPTLAVVMLAQVVATAAQSAIVVQEGLSQACTQPYALNIFLAQHYDGGRILEDLSPGDVSLSDTGIDLKNVVDQGSTDLWPQALAHPEKTVEWVISFSAPNNALFLHLHSSNSTFLTHFTLVLSDSPSGLLLYQRKGEPQLPLRPVPPDIPANPCTTTKKL